MNGFSTSYAASPPPASAPRPPPSASYPKPPPRSFSSPFHTSSPPPSYPNASSRSSPPFHDSSQQSPRDTAPPLPPRYAKHFDDPPFPPQSRSYSPPADYPQPQPPASSTGRQESGFAPSPPSHPPPRRARREDDGYYSDSYNEATSQFDRDDFDSPKPAEVLHEKRPNSEQYFHTNEGFSRPFDPSSLPSLSSQNTRKTPRENRRHHVFNQPDPYDIFKRFFGTNDFNQAASMRFVSLRRHS